MTFDKILIILGTFFEKTKQDNKNQNITNN